MNKADVLNVNSLTNISLKMVLKHERKWWLDPKDESEKPCLNFFSLWSVHSLENLENDWILQISGETWKSERILK